MFAWFISLLFLFTNHGGATAAPSVNLDGSGNRNVAPADNQQPGPQEPPDPDGKGHP
ncbi:MAG TPA: hypothetical protein VFF64_20995 [Candidatus Eremiobacteraceae bacterium]|nr:hypothetical protein [Candidatus Eremiobacteraceae bacterium]